MKLLRESTDYHITPVGLHQARCSGMIEVGTIESTFNGITKLSPKVIGEFEILDWNDGCGNTPILTQIYTVSVHPKSKLRKDMEMLNGKAFNNEQLSLMDTNWMIGRHCLLNVVHVDVNGFVVAKINAVLPLLPSTPPLEAVHQDRYFNIDRPDLRVFIELAEWTKKMIRQSQEWPSFSCGEGWENLTSPDKSASNEPSF
jgi:hypothetical protein